MTDKHSIYDGRELRGTIAKAPNGFAAFGVDGQRLGSIFQTRTEAVRAVLSSPRAAENALIDAIEALKEGAP
jgi:hypothetical protein